MEGSSDKQGKINGIIDNQEFFLTHLSGVQITTLAYAYNILTSPGDQPILSRLDLPLECPGQNHPNTRQNESLDILLQKAGELVQPFDL